MDVSIIIVNYNTRELTLQCINSIYEHTTDLEFEIVIVDNASIDGTCSTIRESFPQVIIIESEINLGFGRANNLGIMNSKGKYLFLLNSDTILLNNAVLLFYNFMNANNTNEKIGAIGGLLIDAEGKQSFSFGEFPTIGSELKYLKRKIIEKVYRKASANLLNLENETFKEVEFISGADLFIPKKVINRIGGFDPDFFMYYEETDLQKRMANNNYKRLIINDPKIIHLEGGSFTSSIKFSYARFSLSHKSFHIYLKKHFTGINYVVFRLFMILFRLTIVFDRRFNFFEKVKLIQLVIQGY